MNTKHICKRSLALLLSVMIAFGAIAGAGWSFSVFALESTGVSVIDSFINDSRFTNGVYWGWDSGPKLSPYSCAQCCAYCADYVKYCFGYNTPKAGTYFTGATNIRAGDVIVVGGENGGGHWFVCLKRSGNSLYVAEGNYAQKVRIGWNYSIVNDSTISGISYSFSHGWHYLADHTCDFKASATITKAPTRTAAGTRVRTCSCGKTLTESIPAIPYTTDLAEGVYTVTTKCKSGLQMATNSGSSYNVFIADNNYADQYWLFRKNSDGTYTIENAYYDGKVLDVEGKSMVNDGNLFAYNEHGGDNQRFYVISTGGGYYKLVAKSSYLNVDNYCARVNSGNNIIQYEDNGSDAQRWALKLSNPSLNLSATSVTLAAGSSKTITRTIGREMYGASFTYTNSNPGVCSVDTSGSWNGMSKPMVITGKSGGTSTITVTIIDYDTGIELTSRSITVTVPDTTKPSVSLSSTNNAASSQAVTLSLSDNAGLAGYYWGTSSNYSSNTYTSVSGTGKSVTKTVSSAGTYYLTAKDTSGNVSSTVSKTFYKTTLNANGGSVSPTSVITMSGNSFTLPTPTRSGYTFKSWNTNSGGTGTAYTGSFKPSGSVTLYAQWKANSFTVTFDANGGTCSTGSKSVTCNSAYGILPTASRTGYAFDGWYTSASGGTKITEETTVSATSGHTLYAHWIMKPTAVITSTNNVAAAQTVTLSMHDDKGLAGYYWGTSSTSYNNPYVQIFGKDKTVTVTVSAESTYYLTVVNTSGVSSRVLLAFYRTTLDANGGSVSPQSVLSPNALSASDSSPGSLSLELLNQNRYGLAFTLPAASRSGYTFKGWNTRQDGSGKAYAAGDSFRYYIIYGLVSSGGLVMTGTTESETALYAQWEKKAAAQYTLTYSANGGSGTFAPQTGSGTIILTDAEPTSDGYTLLGWAKSSTAAAAQYAPGASFSLSANTTLYAVWQKKAATQYSLIYNTNSGRGVFAPQTGSGTIILTDAEPTRDGYTFLGWAKSSTAAAAQYAPGASFSLSADTTLYAVWKKTTAADPTDDTAAAPTVSIRNFVPNRTESYFTTVKFYAFTENKPDNTVTQWYVNGRKAAESDSYSVYGAKSDYTVQVRLIDSSGEVLSESETETVHIFFSFIEILFSLWRVLFGIPHYVEQ